MSTTRGARGHERRPVLSDHDRQKRVSAVLHLSVPIFQNARPCPTLPANQPDQQSPSSRTNRPRSTASHLPCGLRKELSCGKSGGTCSSFTGRSIPLPCDRWFPLNSIWTCLKEQAFVGLVPFTMTGVRPVGCPQSAGFRHFTRPMSEPTSDWRIETPACGFSASTPPTQSRSSWHGGCFICLTISHACSLSTSRHRN